MGSISNFGSPLMQTIIGKQLLTNKAKAVPELNTDNGSISLAALTSTHYSDLYEVAKKIDQYKELDRETFTAALSSRHRGFVMVEGGAVVGAITFTDYTPETDATVHFLIDPAKQQQWVTDVIFKRVFDYAFKELNLPRVSAWLAQGIESQVDQKALEALGFSYEGTKRNLLKHHGNHHSVDFYGLLSNERRF